MTIKELKELIITAKRGAGFIYAGSRSVDGTTKVFKITIPAGYPDIKIEELKAERLDAMPAQAYWKTDARCDWKDKGISADVLAFALIWDATGKSYLAMEHYKTFRDAFFPGWGNTWRIDGLQLQKWLELKEEGKSAHA
jgi:hypothetical protein